MQKCMLTERQRRAQSRPPRAPRQGGGRGSHVLCQPSSSPTCARPSTGTGDLHLFPTGVTRKQKLCFNYRSCSVTGDLLLLFGVWSLQHPRRSWGVSPLLWQDPISTLLTVSPRGADSGRCTASSSGPDGAYGACASFRQTWHAAVRTTPFPAAVRASLRKGDVSMVSTRQMLRGTIPAPQGSSPGTDGSFGAVRNPAMLRYAPTLPSFWRA